MLDRIIAAQVFVETVERGTATAAAEALNMSRAMASRYLSAMEEWAGVRLLHRSTRHLGLTPAGEVILDQCQSLLEVADGISDLSKQAQEPQGTLRVAVPGLFAQGVLIPLLNDFCQRYPKVVLDLQVSDRTIDLVQDRIDVAIRMTNHLDKAVVARKLGGIDSALYASPQYLEKHGTPQHPDELKHHACLIYARFGGQTWELKNQTQEAKVKVNCVMQTTESLMLLQGAISGLGVTLLPVFAAHAAVQRGELLRILPCWQPISLNIYTLYATRHHLPSNVRAFVDFLANALPTHQPNNKGNED